MRSLKIKNKRGALSLADAPNLVILIVIIGIVAALGLSILADMQSTQTSGSAAYNATGKTIEGISKFTDQMPTIGLAVAMIIIIGIIFLLYSTARGGGRGGV